MHVRTWAVVTCLSGSETAQWVERVHLVLALARLTECADNMVLYSSNHSEREQPDSTRVVTKEERIE